MINSWVPVRKLGFSPAFVTYIISIKYKVCPFTAGICGREAWLQMTGSFVIYHGMHIVPFNSNFLLCCCLFLSVYNKKTITSDGGFGVLCSTQQLR